MIYSKYKGVKVSSIAVAVSEKVQHVEELKKTEDERMITQFIKKTGITQIHKADSKYTAADYGIYAAKSIEKKGGFKASEIGVLIFLTQNPDYRTPSTACVIQKRLGLSKSCVAFDVNLGCSGFVYGLSIASSLLVNSDAEKALVIVGDTLARGRITDDVLERSSNTSLLFGDASAAILLEKDADSEICAGLMTDGSGYKALTAPYGAWKHPIGPESVPGDDLEVFNFTIREVPEIITEFLKKNNSTVDDYDSVILHQANMMIIKQIAKRIKVPLEKVPISLDRYGNTSGASIPVTIADKYGDKEKGTFKILASGYGVGLSWGVVSFEVNTENIHPIYIGVDEFDDGFIK